VLTLTGWAALAGILALATLLLAAVVVAVRRYVGPAGGTHGQRYTLVVKHEPREQELTQRGAAGAARLPRR
jgi:negative regulator of sigma E activity